MKDTYYYRKVKPRWAKHPIQLTPVELERFMRKVEINDVTGCWQWKAFADPDGYGRFYAQQAHRVAYEHFNKASVPKGLELDHLCNNKGCVNPEHLEAVTRTTNIRRRHERR